MGPESLTKNRMDAHRVVEDICVLDEPPFSPKRNHFKQRRACRTRSFPNPGFGTDKRPQETLTTSIGGPSHGCTPAWPSHRVVSNLLSQPCRPSLDDDVRLRKKGVRRQTPSPEGLARAEKTEPTSYPVPGSSGSRGRAFLSRVGCGSPQEAQGCKLQVSARVPNQFASCAGVRHGLRIG